MRLGKPRIFVKDSGRLVAVGGSRNPEGSGIHVIKAPKLVKILPMEKMLPFEIDDEYAKFAASAIPNLSKMSKKVDIRDLKRLAKMQALENRDLGTVLKDENRKIVHHIIDKLSSKDPKDEQNEDEKLVKNKEDLDEIHINDKTEMEIVSQEETEKSADSEEFAMAPNDKVHNEWSNEGTRGKMPIDMNDDKPIVTEQFKKAMEAKKISNLLSGVDVCDVPDCYCKSSEDSNFVSKSTTPQTASGSVTPKELAKTSSLESKTKTAKNLKKVQRALKTLGVNFLHFDEEDNAENKTSVNSDCVKEFCQLGCVCDSINGKAATSLPPSHCGKVECMFHCICSKDALRLTNGLQSKIGIAAEGLRSASFKKMAQEELKFSNTIVASGLDLLMIGGASAGRQKRERKVPSRYQDTDAFFDTSGAGTSGEKEAAAGLLMLEENDKLMPAHVHGLPVKDSLTRKLTQDSLKYEKIKKCTVIMPRLDFDLDSLKVWCMFHNNHNCPCAKYANPLRYAPDVNASRNVAKRSLGNNFKTKKRLSSENNSAQIVSLEFNEDQDQPAQAAPAKRPSFERVEMCRKYPHDPNLNSARTFGHAIKGSLKKATKYPHKVTIGND